MADNTRNKCKRQCGMCATVARAINASASSAAARVGGAHTHLVRRVPLLLQHVVQPSNVGAELIPRSHCCRQVGLLLAQAVQSVLSLLLGRVQALPQLVHQCCHRACARLLLPAHLL
jgi:hypothetical protein